jgi:hypothetical protein
MGIWLKKKRAMVCQKHGNKGKRVLWKLDISI